MAGAPRYVRESKEPHYSLREITVAVGLASGVTKNEIAESLGCSERTIFNIIEGKAGIIEELLAAVKPLVRVNKREMKAIALENAEKEMEKLIGPAIAAIADSMEGGCDPKTAAENGWKVYQQLKGTPASTVKLQGSATVTHRHELFQMPKSLARAFAHDLQNDLDLIAPSRQIAPPEQQITTEDREEAVDVG